jgi:hypothetical protein
LVEQSHRFIQSRLKQQLHSKIAHVSEVVGWVERFLRYPSSIRTPMMGIAKKPLHPSYNAAIALRAASKL